MESQANPIEFETTEDGVVPAGAILISFYNSGKVDCIVNGVTLKAGKARNYGFAAKPYRAIAYQPNGSTLIIMITI